MSADSWGECPRCRAKRVSEKIGQQIARDRAYGNVSIVEFDKLRAIADAPLEEDVVEMREDYEFYLSAETGEFSANYSAQCKNEDCGFEFTFKHEEMIEKLQPQNDQESEGESNAT